MLFSKIAVHKSTERQTMQGAASVQTADLCVQDHCGFWVDGFEIAKCKPLTKPACVSEGVPLAFIKMDTFYSVSTNRLLSQGLNQGGLGMLVDLYAWCSFSDW